MPEYIVRSKREYMFVREIVVEAENDAEAWAMADCFHAEMPHFIDDNGITSDRLRVFVPRYDHWDGAFPGAEVAPPPIGEVEPYWKKHDAWNERALLKAAKIEKTRLGTRDPARFQQEGPREREVLRE